MPHHVSSHALDDYQNSDAIVITLKEWVSSLNTQKTTWDINLNHASDAIVIQPQPYVDLQLPSESTK
jgi:hypothetical protein